MKLKLILLFTLAFISLSPLWAIGEWQLFNNSGTYQQLASLDQRLYTLCGRSVFWYDRSDGTSGSLNISSGLHGSDVAFLASTDHYLAIVYTDGLVDALDSEGHIHDFVDLQNKSITGSRTINGVKPCGDEIFLACDFGVVAVDLSQMQVSYTFTTPEPALLAFRFGDYLYYSCKNGLKRCHKDSNYRSVSQWESVLSQPIVDVAVFTDIAGVQHCWYTDQDKATYGLASDGTATDLRLFNNQKLYPSAPYVFGSGWGVQVYWVKGERTEGSMLHHSPFNNCSGYYAENDSSFYVLNRTTGLRHVKFRFKGGLQDGSYEFDDSPSAGQLNHRDYLGNKLIDMQFDADRSFVAINGGQMRVDQWEGMFLALSVINRQHDDEWSYILEDSVIDWMRRRADDPASIPADYFRGLTSIACHPEIPGRYYVGTLQHGLFVFDGDSLVAQYDATNTTDGPVPVSYDSRFTQLSALAFDDDGSLWTAYTFADCPLAALSPDETKWLRHPLTSQNSTSNIGRIIPTHPSGQHLIWLVRNTGYQKCSVSILSNPAGAGSTALDESVTFSMLVDQDGNTIRPDYIYDLCQDKEGNIWILTSNGPLVVEDPLTTYQYVHANANRGLVRRVKIPRNDGTNLADYLMAEVSTNCMAIDNYNRKWVGTTDNGLYLLSADGITELEHFTTANSLLPSDNIVALAYDDENNRLYISTDTGLACYATDDLVGEDDFESLHCFPNPVRPDYQGELRIMGLMDHSWVSVTTTAGDLIFRSQSEGGTISWDLRDASGNRIDPGIYVIHGVDNAAKTGKICKFLVL